MKNRISYFNINKTIQGYLDIPVFMLSPFVFELCSMLSKLAAAIWDALTETFSVFRFFVSFFAVSRPESFDIPLL